MFISRSIVYWIIHNTQHLIKLRCPPPLPLTCSHPPKCHWCPCMFHMIVFAIPWGIWYHKKVIQWQVAPQTTRHHNGLSEFLFQSGPLSTIKTTAFLFSEVVMGVRKVFKSWCNRCICLPGIHHVVVLIWYVCNEGDHAYLKYLHGTESLYVRICQSQHVSIQRYNPYQNFHSSGTLTSWILLGIVHHWEIYAFHEIYSSHYEMTLQCLYLCQEQSLLGVYI